MREAMGRQGDALALDNPSPRPAAIDLSTNYTRVPDAEQPAWIVEKYFGP